MPEIHLAAVIKAGKKNAKVRESSLFPSVVEDFAGQAKVEKSELMKMIADAGMPIDKWDLVTQTI
jgi:hypothetical protein